VISLIKRLLKSVLSPRQYRRLQQRLWRYICPLTVDYCPVTLPWFPGASASTDAAHLHRLAATFNRPGEWSPITAIFVGAAAMRWPVQFAAASLKAFLTYGDGVERRYGVKKRTQVKELVRFGVGYNIPATYYYRLRLFNQANAARAPLFIHADEMDVLYPLLCTERATDQALAHKDQFLESARNYALPVVDALATFAEGRVQRWFGDRELLPLRDLVLKPVDMACGRGFECWHCDPATSTWHSGTEGLTAGELVDYCCRSAVDHPLILQIRLRNHQQLLPLAGDALSTIRVVTYRRPSGEEGILLACLRMATGSLKVDNFEAGGIAALIDRRTRTLGAAVAKDPRRGSFSHHPDSGYPIQGTLVPYADEATALALKAHRAFPWAPFVGWDVVVTDDGPLLLEANPDWCVELAQIVMNQPLGETVYPEVFLEHLAAQDPERLTRQSKGGVDRHAAASSRM
jgi:hypothetical protein